MLIVKVIIGILLGLILLSLVMSMSSFIKDQKNSNRTVKMLTIRIALSIVTFIFIFISFYMGWIQPHGIMPTAS